MVSVSNELLCDIFASDNKQNLNLLKNMQVTEYSKFLAQF